MSIIVPVYNVEKYLKRCVDSLVGQTLKDIEITISNFKFTISSDDIFDKYAEECYLRFITNRKDNKWYIGRRS